MIANIKKMADKKEKNKRLATQQDRVSSVSRITQFMGGVKNEFTKITWTSPQELKTYTNIVVGTTFIFGIMIYFSDLTIRGCLESISSIIQLVFRY